MHHHLLLHVQKCSLIKGRVLVRHDLKHDLWVLEYSHPQTKIRDTAYYLPITLEQLFLSTAPWIPATSERAQEIVSSVVHELRKEELKQPSSVGDCNLTDATCRFMRRGTELHTNGAVDLKKLSKAVLGSTIQSGEHSAAEDAQKMNGSQMYIRGAL